MLLGVLMVESGLENSLEIIKVDLELIINPQKKCSLNP